MHTRKCPGPMPLGLISEMTRLGEDTWQRLNLISQGTSWGGGGRGWPSPDSEAELSKISVI